jgi:beta-glucosidase
MGEYAEIVATRLGDRVRHWITLNEPRTFSFMGYGTGRHAPGRTGWSTALRAAHHAHLAHAAATRAIRVSAPTARVGICHDVADLVAATADAADAQAVVRHDGAMHRWFLEPTFGRGYPADLLRWYEDHELLGGIDPSEVVAAEPIDFLALNYYRRERIAAAPVDEAWGVGSRVIDRSGEHAGNGWEIWPEGLRSVLKRIHSDYAPAAIAITENGATFPETVDVDGSVRDEARRNYLARHLAAASDAIEDGVPLIAYFVWSLLDNFEWALGYDTRFGIVRVDFATQRRTIKASGRWYADLMRQSSVR